MARDYQRKLEAMRAYAKTPAGIASKKRSQERYLAKCGHVKAALKYTPQPLQDAMANWR